MRFSTFILKNLLRRKARTFLTVGGVAVAVGAVVALVGISQGFENSFYDLYARRGVDLMVVRAGRAEKLTSRLNQDLADKIRALPGVQEVTYGLVDVVALESHPDGVAVQGWSADSSMFTALRIVSGRKLEVEDKGKRRVMVGDILARSLGKTTGDYLVLPYHEDPFEIIGIFESFNVFENSSILMLVDDLQKYMELDNPPRVSGFQVTVKKRGDKEMIEEVRQQIEGLADQMSAMPTKDYVSSTTQIKLANGMAWMTSVIALIIGVIGILNTMVMSVFERTREIGILRAMGWRKSRVVRMILAESMVLSIAGAIVGILGAVIVNRILTQVPPVNGFISGKVAPIVMVEGFLIALAVGLLGGAYPAFRGAQLLPTEAIRHE